MYYVYAANSESLPFVKAENSKSFDIGFEKKFTDYGLNIDLTYFINMKMFLKDGKITVQGASYTTQNADVGVKSQKD